MRSKKKEANLNAQCIDDPFEVKLINPICSRRTKTGRKIRKNENKNG